MFYQDEQQHEQSPATAETEDHTAQQTDAPEQPATEKNPEAYNVQDPIANEEVPTTEEQTIINQQNAEVNNRLQANTTTDAETDQPKK